MVVFRPFRLLGFGEIMIVLLLALSVGLNPSRNSIMLWFAVLLLGATVLRGAWSRSPRGHGAKALRRCGICPACLYDLAAQAREDDGFVTCPECGGAWRLPRPTRPL